MTLKILPIKILLKNFLFEFEHFVLEDILENNIYLAHKNINADELLEDHLYKAASLASNFAEVFDNAKIGLQLGLLHDIGKRTIHFQKVLEHKENKIDHAITGGIFYYNNFDIDSAFMRKTISGIIAAHHSYLRCDKHDYQKIDDFSDCAKIMSPNETDKIASVSSEEEYNDILEYAKEKKLIIPIRKDDYFDIISMSNNAKEFYTRMLCSCLVDADYTATAEFDGEDNIQNPHTLNPSVLLIKLKYYRDNIIKKSDQLNPINEMRGKVFDACTLAGKEKIDALYTLTAPTGTAKTLALLQFALEKAKALGKTSIFIILPYLSIISQNAKVYKEICGNDIVLEDDSLTEYTDETKLYSERWDSPIIVTTSVKFFESLFESTAVNLRKLHNISNSVIIFDECQTLPANVLNCTLEIMNELTTHYHSTVLFSTATLPSFEYRKNIIWSPKEIIPDVIKLYENYHKIKNTVSEFDTQNIYDSRTLLKKSLTCNQMLFVFNTVKKAQDMYQTLSEEYGEENCFILSSKMCPLHKLDTISVIKNRLLNNENCFVSSTQCIEAGVDVDFPNGAREYSPFDSEVQTAGRINRNCKGNGYILYFKHEDSSIYDYPSAYYRNASELSLYIAKNFKPSATELDMMKEYYKNLYTSISDCMADDDELSNAINDKDFAEITKKYKLIDDKSQVNIIVPYENAMDRYKQIVTLIHNNENCITKSQMRDCAMIKVTSYKKSDVERCCEKLYFRTSNGKSETNWYLLSDKNRYTKQGIKLIEGDDALCL